MRASDINRQRRLRFGQAILLGCRIEHRSVPLWIPGGRWYGFLPHEPHCPTDYLNGAFRTRHEVVDHLLTLLGIINIGEEIYPYGGHKIEA